ncbi:MAG: ABC transporter ATP-binding protein [Flavobacteriales bacterium]|nr:ABC transporter ATP-binding protein [Flavobacteriales bacterium]
MISVEDIRKNFGNLRALDGVSVELSKGRSYAFIGPNGSGKTTLIKCILGLVIPTSGDIRLEGESILNQWDYRASIGYMPQIGRYPDNMRIGQLMDMMMNIRNHSGALDEELIAEFRLRDMYDKPMHGLSGGTRQKVSAALAFLFNPPMLILDEPTAGLDPVSVEILKDKINRERTDGKLIVITSHVMSDLDELSSEVIYICDGRIHYNDSIDNLKQETGHESLGRAISKIMNRTATA